MGPLLLEWAAEIYGATRRGRWLPFFITLTVTLVVTLVLGARWGARGLIPGVAVLVFVPLAARNVITVREELWRAACLELDDPRQRPRVHPDVGFMAFTAVALGRLALAVDAVRRGSYVDANTLVPHIDRPLLRPEEERMLEAVRAMISLGMGDSRRAAQQAVVALPTGSDAIDVTLGRAAVADAWGSEKRLAALDAAWAGEGIEGDLEGAMPRLRKLVQVRLDPGALAALSPADARALSDEARAIGDESLATALETRGRASAYR